MLFRVSEHTISHFISFLRVVKVECRTIGHIYCRSMLWERWQHWSFFSFSNAADIDIRIHPIFSLVLSLKLILLSLIISRPYDTFRNYFIFNNSCHLLAHLPKITNLLRHWSLTGIFVFYFALIWREGKEARRMLLSICMVMLSYIKVHDEWIEILQLS